jgi:hypothetical protein
MTSMKKPSQFGAVHDRGADAAVPLGHSAGDALELEHRREAGRAARKSVFNGSFCARVRREP